VQVDLAGADVGAQIVRAYDVVRSGKSAKRAFETVFKAMVGVLEDGLLKASGRDHTTAMGSAALCVGGMVIARSIDDHALADDLREACMAVALRLGGWDAGTNPKSRKN
jgi:TetR/AcrR family transcriptional regulator, transcriptional repressor for nem operon